MTRLMIPKAMLDWIDDNRGVFSRQVFILKMIEQNMAATQVATDSHLGDNNDTAGNKKAG